MPLSEFFLNNPPLPTPQEKTGKETIRMVDALATLQNLTAQLETLSLQLGCTHDPGERQTLLKRFRSVLDRADELIAREFTPNGDAGAADAAASSG